MSIVCKKIVSLQRKFNDKTNVMDSKDKSQNNQEAYEKMMKDYSPSPYVNTEWEMQNGIYKQYSVYDENSVSVTGTANSIKAL